MKTRIPFLSYSPIMTQTHFASISNHNIPFHVSNNQDSLANRLHQSKPTDWCFVTQNNNPVYIVAEVPDEFNKNDIHSLIRYGIQFSKQYSPTNSVVRFSRVGA